MAIGMALTPAVLEVLDVLRADGCRVEHDRDAGTTVAWDGETRVYQALQKGASRFFAAQFCTYAIIQY